MDPIMLFVGIVVVILVLALIFAAFQKAMTLFPGVLSPKLIIVAEVLLLLFAAVIIWHYFAPHFKF